MDTVLEGACTLTCSSNAELDNELYKACTQAGKLYLLPENKSRVLGEYTFPADTSIWKHTSNLWSQIGPGSYVMPEGMKFLC